MTHTIAHTGNGAARIQYPVFEGGREAAAMNRFYRRVADCALAFALEGLPAGHVYTVQCTVRPEGERTLVELRLWLRHRGRRVAERVLTHTWEGGVLVPPRRKKRRGN